MILSKKRGKWVKTPSNPAVKKTCGALTANISGGQGTAYKDNREDFIWPNKKQKGNHLIDNIDYIQKCNEYVQLLPPLQER